MNAVVGGGAKDQVARLLRLVPYLHSRDGVHLDDAAQVLGVSAEQVLADLKVLLMCGLPGGYPDDLIDVDLDALEPETGDGVIRVSNADYLARPLRLTATEATALIVALRALRAGADAATREVVDRAIGKLEEAADQGSGPAAGASPGVADLDAVPSADVGIRSRLEEATRRKRQLQITYYVPARDEESERIVDPRGLVSSSGVAYLDAWCHTAAAPRLFRLDRIHDAQVLVEPIQTPVEEPRDLSAGLFSTAIDAQRVTLRVGPAARWVSEYYPVEAIREADGGELLIDLLVADPRWLQRLLLRLAPHAHVVQPQELAQEFTAQTRRTLSHYGATMGLGSVGSGTDPEKNEDE